MKLKAFESILNNGQKVQYQYDPEGDFLEVFFRSGEANCAVELTESIVLRFDWDSATPISLGFISFPRLIKPDEYGEVYFQQPLCLNKSE